jgi:hypothetical protein
VLLGTGLVASLARSRTGGVVLSHVFSDFYAIESRRVGEAEKKLKTAKEKLGQ